MRPGIADGDGETRLLQRQAHGEMIRARVLAHDMRSRLFLQERDEFAVTRRCVGKLPTAALARDDQRRFGHIDSMVA